VCDLVDDLVKQCGGDPRLRRAAGDHAAANDVHRTMMQRAEEQMRTGGVGGGSAVRILLTSQMYMYVCGALFCTALYCSLLRCCGLLCILLLCIALRFTLLHHSILCFTALYFLYCSVLHCNVFQCIVLY
jgi:hypothetical protein